MLSKLDVRYNRQPVCRLAVITGPNAGMEFVIPARGGGIGRGHWNAIQLSDPQVSRSHCAVELHDSQQVLVDVGSFSGTRVNGQSITRHTLEQGDVISLGNTRLAYMPPEPDGDWSMERTDMHAPSGSEILGGRYEILGLIGVGGMGSVYRVRDRELDEIIALKALKNELSSSPSMRTHFRREVKLARRVTHKNVARIFDIGEHHGQRFLTMEFIDGESLSTMIARRGALPVRDVVDIGLELCSGLAAAHAADIVHRDLKPDNILIALDGRVVITDFGIALDPALSNEQSSALVGTPAYMAPELLNQGSSSGSHTDVYSLGCVLYEMVTGQAAWTGESQVEIITARLFEPPPDPRELQPDMPEELAWLILTCMAADPAERHRDAAGVADALKRVPLPPSDDMSLGTDHDTSDVMEIKTLKRVAVIPFQNQGDGQADYLAEGLTSELMDTLSMTAGLYVYPFAQVARCKAPHTDPYAVGRELRAQVVLTGSVQVQSPSIHVNARLINVADGFQLWGESFEFETRNLLVISDRAVSSMVDALALTTQPSRRTAVDPKAIELYLRGRSEYRKFWSDAVSRALEYFEGARELAPEDPTILAACAMTRARLLFFRGGQNDAATLARKAISVAPNYAESHLALAMARFYVNDLEVALREASLAKTLSPTLADAHLLIGRILMECGSLKDAEHALEQATLLDPQLHVGLRDLAHARLLAGHALMVVKDSMNNMPKRPDATTLRGLQLTRAALWLGSEETGREALTLLGESEQSEQSAAFGLCQATLALLEEPSREWELPPQLRDPTTGSVRRKLFFWQIDAEVSAFRKDTERLFDVLSRAGDAGLTDLNWLTHCPLLSPYREEPRFQEIYLRVRERANKVVAGWQRL